MEWVLVFMISYLMIGSLLGFYFIFRTNTPDLIQDIVQDSAHQRMFQTKRNLMIWFTLASPVLLPLFHRNNQKGR